MVIARKGHAVARVRNDDLRGGIGIGFVQAVFRAKLVFLKIHGAAQLAHIVIIAAHARKQGIGPDGLRRGLGQIGHHDGVVVGAGGFQQQPAHQRMIGVGQLHQLGGGRQVEQRLQQRLNSQTENSSDARPAHGFQRVGQHAAHAAGHQAQRQHD